VAGAYYDVTVSIAVIQMVFTLIEVEALINVYQIETCLWGTNDEDYTDIDEWA